MARATALARRHGMRSVAPDVFPYLALAVEAHLTQLLKATARVATQRGDAARCATPSESFVQAVRRLETHA